VRVLISFASRHHPTADYVRLLRNRLHHLYASHLYASTTFALLPADINSQILNFGAPSPIDIQISGPERPGKVYPAPVVRTADSG
jgi:hypothetical protein